MSYKWSWYFHFLVHVWKWENKKILKCYITFATVKSTDSLSNSMRKGESTMPRWISQLIIPIFSNCCNFGVSFSIAIGREFTSIVCSAIREFNLLPGAYPSILSNTLGSCSLASTEGRSFVVRCIFVSIRMSSWGYEPIIYKFPFYLSSSRG